MTAELVAPLEGLAGDTRILEVMFWNELWDCWSDCVGKRDMRSHRSWGEAKLLKEKKTAVLRRGAETRLKLWNQLKADEKFDEIDTMCSEVGQPMLEKEARTFYKIAMQSRNEKSKIAGERCKRGSPTSTNGTRYVYQLVLNLNVHGGFGGDDDGRTGRKKFSQLRSLKVRRRHAHGTAWFHSQASASAIPISSVVQHVQELHRVHNPLVTSYVQGGRRRLQRCAANSSRDIPNIPHKGSTTLAPLTFPPENRIERDRNTGVDSFRKVSVGTFGPVDHLREPPPTRVQIFDIRKLPAETVLSQPLRVTCPIFLPQRPKPFAVMCRWGWNGDCDGDCGVDCDCEKWDGITSGNKDNGQGRHVFWDAVPGSTFESWGRGSKSEVGVAPVNRIFFKISRVHRKVADGNVRYCAVIEEKQEMNDFLPCAVERGHRKEFVHDEEGSRDGKHEYYREDMRCRSCLWARGRQSFRLLLTIAKNTQRKCSNPAPPDQYVRPPKLNFKPDNTRWVALNALRVLTDVGRKGDDNTYATMTHGKYQQDPNLTAVEPDAPRHISGCTQL
ncbi:hypothetical protein EV359DRAFT_63832 [Lentinula novae-zelandiae]|nr:hypothetical protein EV359DRAFT_63832 [Lentinula novae-zelandiae]